MPITEKESIRWLENLRQSTGLVGHAGDCVHIGDRESDIYELSCLAEELKTHFLVRTCVNRLADDGERTVAARMKKAVVKGRHRIVVRNKNGDLHEADLEIKFERLLVLPPIGKRRDYPGLTLTVIHAVERGTPSGREKIAWKLATNLPVKSLAQAIEKLNWYAMRWKIEVFHKILKSGCKAGEFKLRSSERPVNLVALLRIVGWRVFWLTMPHRAEPGAPWAGALAPTEVRVLDELVKTKPGAARRATISDCILKTARLGGHLARAADPPPGNMAIWRGLSRLTDIHLGFSLAAKLVGN